MFLDRITLQLKAGNGGDGAIHFASIKYNAFAGPDGGDGGNGGDVVLVGRRDMDSLEHLRTANTSAVHGQPGGSNQKIGVSASALEIGVPLGVVVEDSTTLEEMGTVTAGEGRLVVVRGGRGGVGNPRYATGRRRAPRIAHPGFPGEEREAILTYRIFCDTLLLEASGDPDWQLLPLLLKKEADEIDWELYRRKPRWVRLAQDFRLFDCAYLPLGFLDDGSLDAPHLSHVYWPQHICVNLCPVEEPAADLAEQVLALLLAQPMRRADQITVLLPLGINPPTALPGGLGISLQMGAPVEANLAAFLGQLTGGTAA